MKFGAEYQEALRQEAYPSQWIESAISYKKLKKCIKRIKEELLELGLDQETLDALWQHVGTSSFSESGAADDTRMMHYKFLSDSKDRFVPRLTIALDPKDGSPMDAWLSPETRRVLQRVGRRESRRDGRMSDIHESSLHEKADSSNASVSDSHRSDSLDTSPVRDETKQATCPEVEPIVSQAIEDEIETIEIPLTSDSEFFQILRRELKALDVLQNQERNEITDSINSLSSDLQIIKSSNSRFAREELNTWRDIFRFYIESEVFMSNHESDAGVRPASKAAEQLKYFTSQLANVHKNPRKPKSKESHIALDRFLNINATLLRLLKFQELNRQALGKILKKFDKQTSLHAASSVTPQQIMMTLSLDNNTSPVSPRELARSACFAISQNLLALIPQLDDYLCPICSYITYKPVRLRCNHVFCIRCMIHMQKDNKDECPLCRKRVVLDATGENLDLELKKFLKREFPEEVKEKKKENELAAGRELFGEDYDGTTKCSVM